MAKRYKIVPEVDVSKKQLGMTDILQSALHVQDLMSSHEVAKIKKLDAEMRGILQQKGLNVDEKVRRFEEKLAAFRQVQQKIAREGMSMIPQQSDQDGHNAEEEQRLLEQMLEKVVQKVLGNQNASAVQSNKTAPPTVVAAVSETTPMPAVFKNEMTDTESSGPLNKVMRRTKSTPLLLDDAEPSVRRGTSRISSHSYTPTVVRERVHAALKRNGMTVDPLNQSLNLTLEDPNDIASHKKTSLTIARKTYDRAMDHLLLEKKESQPYRAGAALKTIYRQMQNGSFDFDALLHTFPNLAQYHSAQQNPTVSADGLAWARLK